MQPECALLRGLTVVGLASLAAAQTCTTDRVSLARDGGQADLWSVEGALSSDGRFVVFISTATNLVPGDTNGSDDVFLRDRATGALTAISVRPDGALGASDSFAVRFAALGSAVAFESGAWDLVPNDTNGVNDIFVRDLVSGVTERVSVNGAGDGANAHAHSPSISADARYIAFWSRASNLIPNDPTSEDVFVRDRHAGTTERVSVDSAGAPGDGASLSPQISSNGRWVVFVSTSRNLVPGDTNQNWPWLYTWDVFLRDRQNGTTERVNVSSSGAEDFQGVSEIDRLGISDDGRFVVFASQGRTLVSDTTTSVSRVYVRDRALGTTRLISRLPDGSPAVIASIRPMITPDGRFVAFTSWARLSSEDTDDQGDVYVWDSLNDTLSLVSRSVAGVPVAADAQADAISADGSQVLFSSLDGNLVAGDTNNQYDLFVRDCSANSTAICFGTTLACPCGNAGTDGAGCENSFATGGGRLETFGAASVSTDTLQLAVSRLPPTAPVLFFQGTTQTNGGLGASFGDGLRCSSGSVLRLGSKNCVSGTAAFGNGVGGDPLVSIRGSLPPEGGVRTYQGWYRNQMGFCTSAAFNLTNGMRVVWTP